MRTQIALEPHQHSAAKAKAADLGITLAEYIRRLVDRDASTVGPQLDPSSVIALGDSGGSDIRMDKSAAVRRAITRRHPN